MPKPLSMDAGLNPISANKPFALFLDVDGVLIEIANRPEAVSLPPDLTPILAKLVALCGGAVALVSGRSLAFLEGMFGGLGVAMAGLHGVERRMPGGRIEALGINQDQLTAVRAALVDFSQAHPAIEMEDKGMAIALHYRAQPEVGETARAFLEQELPKIAADFHIQPGKMVYEVKPKGMDKGAAIELMLGQAPFAGRLPVFAGDDVTDEYGFAVVNRFDGVSIKVGDGPETIARYSIESVAALRAWLATLAAAAP